jgi:hypothetical protein
VTSVERETPLTADDVPVATPEELGDAIDKHTTKARRLNAEVVEFDFVATLDGQTHTSDQVNVIYESLATNFIDLGSKISAASQLRPGARVLGWTVRHLLSTVLPWTNVVLKKKNKAPCDAGELGATLSAVVMLGASSLSWELGWERLVAPHQPRRRGQNGVRLGVQDYQAPVYHHVGAKRRDVRLS